MTRVIIVDDKPENLYLLKALLQGNGCVVDEARHGAEALIKARLSPPELIVSDLLMPVMDGYTLLRHWKADTRLKSVPFVVYTATYTEPKDERLALALGADAFILKPAEPEVFMARIKEVLEKTHHPDRPPARAPKGDPEALLQNYGDVLIKKLEEKTLQLEESNLILRKDLALRQQAETEANRMRRESEQAREALLNILEDQRRAEAKLKEQLDELNRWHEATLGRETRVLELKREINRLLADAGKPPRYASVTEKSRPAPSTNPYLSQPRPPGPA